MLIWKFSLDILELKAKKAINETLTSNVASKTLPSLAYCNGKKQFVQRCLRRRSWHCLRLSAQELPWWCNKSNWPHLPAVGWVHGQSYQYYDDFELVWLRSLSSHSCRWGRSKSAGYLRGSQLSLERNLKNKLTKQRRKKWSFWMEQSFAFHAVFMQPNFYRFKKCEMFEKKFYEMSGSRQFPLHKCSRKIPKKST